MKTQLFPALKLTALLILLFCGAYTLLISGIAKLAPNHGKGAIIKQGHKTYYTNIGQSFSSDTYFYSRPSAVGYNAAGSGGSNKGPSNTAYLLTVQARIDTFLKHNPGIQASEIPVELVTASGSGLDPHISVQGARVQIKRLAKIRQVTEACLSKLVSRYTEKPLAGIAGPEKINVLKLNLALDSLH